MQTDVTACLIDYINGKLIELSCRDPWIGQPASLQFDDDDYMAQCRFPHRNVRWRFGEAHLIIYSVGPDGVVDLQLEYSDPDMVDVLDQLLTLFSSRQDLQPDAPAYPLAAGQCNGVPTYWRIKGGQGQTG